MYPIANLYLCSSPSEHSFLCGSLLDTPAGVICIPQEEDLLSLGYTLRLSLAASMEEIAPSFLCSQPCMLEAFLTPESHGFAVWDSTRFLCVCLPSEGLAHSFVHQVPMNESVNEQIK